jgi:3-hydroxyisobutyrate dehydrogenase
MSTIAFCGLGMMGSKMAQRLRAADHELRVWNRTFEKARTWAADGGLACESPAQAGRGASEAHLMLSDDDAVNTTLFGPDGLVTGLPSGALIVDHTTVSVAGARERSVRLRREGWLFLQAPVFGSPPNIGEGQGVMLVGGDRTVYEVSKDTLRQILPQHFIAGEKAEDASSFKLMGNSMLMSVVEGLAEFFAIAKASGISPERALTLFDVFNPCGTIQRRGPRMAAGDYTSMFSISMALKDIRLMLAAADESANLPVLKTIEAKMKRLVTDGAADLDLSALGMDVIPSSRTQ